MEELNESIQEESLENINEIISSIINQMSQYLNQPEIHRVIANQMIQRNLIIPYLTSEINQAWISASNESLPENFDVTVGIMVRRQFLDSYEELMQNASLVEELVYNTLSDYDDDIRYFFNQMFQQTMNNVYTKAAKLTNWMDLERLKDRLSIAQQQNPREVLIHWLDEHLDELKEFMIYDINWFRCFGSYNNLNFAHYLKDLVLKAYKEN